MMATQPAIPYYLRTTRKEIRGLSAELKDQLNNAIGRGISIERELASQGASRVFLALDVRGGYDILVKTLPLDVAARLNFLRLRDEVQVLSQLRHACVLPVLSTGQSLGLVWYTTPRVEGTTLRVMLDRQSRLGTDVAVAFASDIADALAYTHARNVPHRDLSPANVLIVRGRALVTDFGIIHAIEQSSLPDPESGQRMPHGTPAYMSPEQAAGTDDDDLRGDVYSLGCLLYEMLTGALPDRGSSHTLLMRASGYHATSLREIRPDVPGHVVSAIDRALAAVPGERFGSAGELMASLRSSGAVVARTASPRRRGSRRLVAAVAIGSTLLAGAALLWRLGR